MDYSFNGDIAKKYGVNEAVLINYIARSTDLYGSGIVVKYRGYTWALISFKELIKAFPFWTEKELRRLIDSIIRKGAVLRRIDFNNAVNVKLVWYALSDKIIAPQKN